MSSNSGTSIPAAYRYYGIFGATFLFAAIFLTVFFRSRLERRRRLLARSLVAHSVFDIEPPKLFDVHFVSCESTQKMPPEWPWEDLMPLSVSTSNATLPPTKGDATSNFNIYVLSRMAVLINMPSSGCPPMSDSAQRNEIPLPYFDIGSMEIGILPGSRDGSSLP
ncbi:hypothetical protein C8J57DRAFT_1311646 [Mycena rebaudengoi]|nr:hypothetical protein C8J57DRAFT_1311646 [Mycena rebaudengoi]